MNQTTPSFEELLILIEDRSTALRKAADAASGLGVRVPSCPDWSLWDLIAHLTEVQHFWAAAVAAGPSEQPPTADEPPPELPAATEALVAALRRSGPESGCWTWWGGSGAPMTAGAVARHQVHEAAVHAFDAQLAAGVPQQVPTVVALDGIAEFISVLHGSSGAWPHDPARIGLHTTEGPAWLIGLTPAGARLLDDSSPTDGCLRGSASDVLLTLYGRLPLDRLRTEGFALSGYSSDEPGSDRSAHTRAANASASSCDVPAFTRMIPRDPSGNVTFRIAVPNGPPGVDSSGMAAPLDDETPRLAVTDPAVAVLRHRVMAPGRPCRGSGRRGIQHPSRTTISSGSVSVCLPSVAQISAVYSPAGAGAIDSPTRPLMTRAPSGVRSFVPG
ncbi:maleylpyruvate isomerase family mycothiol-dependent enzyme [Streptomyces aurantiacus]|uniref:maleylpyruvate isomerase family mycothiol-dependent enzyme n=1 Tax=Streptomyces aurantiacus TaxID=47760 RepID=UPI0035E61ECD